MPMVLSFASTQYSWSSTEINSFLLYARDSLHVKKNLYCTFLYDYYNLFAHDVSLTPLAPDLFLSVGCQGNTIATGPPPLTVLDIPRRNYGIGDECSSKDICFVDT